MSRSHPTLLNLIGQLYGAAADPEQWDEFLRAASAAAGCDKAALTVHDAANQIPKMGYQTGLPEDAMRDYDAHYGALNPVGRIVLEEIDRHGSWCGLARALTPASEYRRSEYYAGWGRPWGVYSAIVAAVPVSDSGGMMALSLMRGEDRPELDLGNQKRIAPLLPHMAGALRIQRTMHALRISRTAAWHALAPQGLELVAVDGRGGVLEMTPGVEDLLRAGDALRLCDGRLTAVHPACQLRLDELLREASATGAGRGAHPGGSMLIERGSDPPLRLQVLPFRADSHLLGVLPCALVLLQGTGAGPQGHVATLTARYGLTPSEARLAASLAATCDLQESAAKLRLTYETARFMLKTIFRKTGTRSQLHLLKLLLSASLL